MQKHLYKEKSQRFPKTGKLGHHQGLHGLNQRFPKSARKKSIPKDRRAKKAGPRQRPPVHQAAPPSTILDLDFSGLLGGLYLSGAQGPYALPGST